MNSIYTNKKLKKFVTKENYFYLVEDNINKEGLSIIEI
jgi:hypothetical protein